MRNILKTGERIRICREYKGLSRRELEKLTKIEEYKWTAIESGKQRTNDEHLTALGKIWPEFRMWIAYGETIPECGQTNPEEEEIRLALGEEGRAAS